LNDLGRIAGSATAAATQVAADKSATKRMDRDFFIAPV
jgi:hypothetical protein